MQLHILLLETWCTLKIFADLHLFLGRNVFLTLYLFIRLPVVASNDPIKLSHLMLPCGSSVSHSVRDAHYIIILATVATTHTEQVGWRF